MALDKTATELAITGEEVEVTYLAYWASPRLLLPLRHCLAATLSRSMCSKQYAPLRELFLDVFIGVGPVAQFGILGDGLGRLTEELLVVCKLAQIFGSRELPRLSPWPPPAPGSNRRKLPSFMPTPFGFLNLASRCLWIGS